MSKKIDYHLLTDRIFMKNKLLFTVTRFVYLSENLCSRYEKVIVSYGY